jgi:hypothetical protein
MFNFFRKRRADKNTTHRPDHWQGWVVVIFTTGLVIVAIQNRDFQQPLYLIAGSILSAYFAVNNPLSR